MEREKRTYSGPLLECDFYPVFSDGRRMPRRAPKQKPTAEEQILYNATQAAKNVIRKVNTNFYNTDYFMHLTYASDKSPQSEEAARKDITNALRRMKDRRISESKKLKKKLAKIKADLSKLPGSEILKEQVKELKKCIKKLEEPFRYLYVIETNVYKSGNHKGRLSCHFHLFVTGGLDRNTMERIWTNGIRTNANAFQPEKFGPEAAALYISKNPQGSKRFCCSRNLKKPKPKTHDGKITRKQVEKMSTERIDDREYWENRYEGYRFIRCYARFNRYNSHWYLTAVMYKTSGEPPIWSSEEWLIEDLC